MRRAPCFVLGRSCWLRLRAKRVRKRLRAKGLRQWRAAVRPRLRAAGGSRLRAKGLRAKRVRKPMPEGGASGGVGSGTISARSGAGFGLRGLSGSIDAVFSCKESQGRGGSLQEGSTPEGCEPRPKVSRVSAVSRVSRSGVGIGLSESAVHKAVSQVARRPQHAPAALGPHRARPQHAPAAGTHIRYYTRLITLSMESTKDMYLYF